MKHFIFILLTMVALTGCRTDAKAPAAATAAQIASAPIPILAPLPLTMQSRAQPLVALPLPPSASVVLLPASAYVEWNASTDPGDFRYNVYYGVNAFTDVVPAGTNLNATVGGLDYWQTYQFAVTSINSDGLESDFSNVAHYMVAKILELHFDFTGDYLLSSTDLLNWSPRDATKTGDAWRVVIDPAKQMEFYRAAPGF